MIEWKEIGTAPRDLERPILVCRAGEDYTLELVRWVDWKPGWWNGDVAYDLDDFTHWTETPEVPGTVVWPQP